jgi:hypothetical protein
MVCYYELCVLFLKIEDFHILIEDQIEDYHIHIVVLIGWLHLLKQHVQYKCGSAKCGTICSSLTRTCHIVQVEAYAIISYARFSLKSVTMREIKMACYQQIYYRVCHQTCMLHMIGNHN